MFLPRNAVKRWLVIVSVVGKLCTLPCRAVRYNVCSSFRAMGEPEL